MKKLFIFCLTLTLFGLPSLSQDLRQDTIEPEQNYSSDFERVLQSDSKQKWVVTESQILNQWSEGGFIQNSPSITIIGKPENDYERIYFKPCKDLVMESVEGEENTYHDNFQMRGIIVGVNDKNSTPQIFKTLNITFANFLTPITNKGGNITLSKTDFIKNKSETDGGAIYNESGNLTIDKYSDFVYNSAKNGNGGAIYNKGNLTVKNSVIGGQHNEGIYHIYDDNITPGDGFTTENENNTDETYKLDDFLGDDDWITIYYLIPEWKNRTHYDSYWVNIYPLGNEAINGGGIYNSGSAKIIDTVFKYNIATECGGGIYNEGNLTVKNSEFFLNSALKGGGIYTKSEDTSIKKTFFRSNKATEGGAIYVESGNVNLINDSFGLIGTKPSNSAEFGGAIYNENGTVKITSSDFMNNKADKGGDIYNSGVMTISKTRFGTPRNRIYYFIMPIGVISSDSENGGIIDPIEPDFPPYHPIYLKYGSSANYGGSIYNEGDLTISSSFFERAEANLGGAIYNSGVLDIKKTFFGSNYATFPSEENSDTNKGGAIYNDGDLTVNKSDFWFNNAYKGYGGAIYNAGGNLSINNTKFLFNNAELGGAFYNEKSKTPVEISKSIFNENTAASGGAIYNDGYLTVKNSKFIKNSALTFTTDEDGFSSEVYTKGGAIYNDTDGKLQLENVTFGNKKKKYKYSNAAKEGSALFNSGNTKINNSKIIYQESEKGAIYNDGKVFIDSSKLSSNRANDGGALYNEGKAIITSSTFKSNKSNLGGAIYNNGITNIYFSKFISNHGAEKGGAIYNENSLIINSSLFKKNKSEYGGAIYNSGNTTVTNSKFVKNKADMGGAIYTAKDSALTLKDVSFIKNNATHNGGAIYADENSTVEIISKDKNVVFKGNKADGKSNAIYLNSATLKLVTQNPSAHTIKIYDEIAGNGSIIVAGDTTLADKVKITTGSNITFSIEQGRFNVENENSLNNASLNLNDESTLNISNNSVGILKLGNLSLSDSNIEIDIDLKSKKSDKVQAQSIMGEGGLTVSKINLTSNSKTPVTVNIGEDSVINSVTTKKAESAEAIYLLRESFDKDGRAVARIFGQKAKPCVLAAPVAAQLGGYLTQINSYDQAFANMDMEMLLTREEREANRTALAQVNGGEWLAHNSVEYDNGINRDGKGLWTRPYASFEKVNLNHGPNVSSISYGNFFGGDAELKRLSNGWTRRFSAYVGYNGSVQDYDKQSIDQNGGTLGITESWYKGNFFTAITANASGNSVNAQTDLGHENFPMLMAGVASKTGYNFEFKQGKFIIQPALLLSYSFVHTFSHENGKGTNIGSSPLHAIQVAPGIKFIANLRHGWQPYLGVNMRWNILDKTHFSMQDVGIPDMSIDPYIEYGVGLQKRFGERFTGFGQAMVRNGGRNGVMLSFGFKWSIGK